MLTATLTLLLAAAPVSLAPRADPSIPEAILDLEPSPDRRDPCEGREGWVGDGEDGRAAPRCEGPDSDEGLDPGGLDGLGDWREEDADPDDLE